MDLHSVYYRVLLLSISQNPRKITFSQVSRSTGVPRSTLYYYFGNSTNAMIEEAVKFGMRSFVRFYEFERNRKYGSWEDFQFARLRKVFRLVQQYPWIPSLYFRYRNTQEEWGKTIREIEEQYCERLAREWEKFQGEKPSADAVRLSGYLKLGLFWGFATEHERWGRKSPKQQQAVLRELGRILSQCLAMR